MLLTPRPGVGPDDLIQTLASTRTEAFNLRGGGGAPTAHKRLLAYLEWAGRAARMLRGRISGKGNCLMTGLWCPGGVCPADTQGCGSSG